ncbi:glycerophosphodiester phosphodiesterase [Desulfuromonas carbonis]|uniref:glycerophosphodiester phosphodiesterase n=1 Tax=Desulfuromonas sp. DDH964 TaxID=1823759 RepID=UPI00078C245C|nr:glycerophosphodiester phosphodiesterase family protein [Desulfuromonas sp. DDH964]AMV72985.1 Glycerophosphoryl diester phosphodiesterase [Desulfuromonas sp. DDH964]
MSGRGGTGQPLPGGGTERRLLIWAHRGASGRAPENTLAAFRAAEADGADGIELDVHLSRDGVPVVIHDETLERTSDGRGPVRDFTLAELRRLDAGSWFGTPFAGEGLPTLEEVFTWAENRLRINVEIKDAAAGHKVLELLQAYPQVRVLVSSFDHRLLALMRQQAPRLPLGFLCDTLFWHRALSRAVAAGAESFHPRVDRTSRQLVQACQRHGLRVYPWTVNSPRQALRLRRLRVDGLFTNYPAELSSLRVGWWQAFDREGRTV